MKDVIVIGGGASGLMAAIVAARRGANVCILERLDRIGKKILVTGNGRCNITNTNIQPKCYHSNYSNNSYMSVMEYFDYEKTKEFFDELGITFIIEGNKVYPRSEQATSVLDVLRMEIEKLDIEVITGVKVMGVKNKNNKWRVETDSETMYEAQKIIVATGGLANNSLGCDGTGYNLLQSLGHKVTTTFPALVHIISSSSYCKMMTGTRIKAVASIFVEDKLQRSEYGEVLFTDDGLSGPTIFQLSRIAARAKIENKHTKVKIDILSELESAEVVNMIYARISNNPERTIETFLVGLIHKRLIIPTLKEAGVTHFARRCDELEYDEIESLSEVLKGFEFEVQGTRGYKYAQVTAGGIKLEDIDFKTMQSKKAKNLFITGEVLDVDGDCGGYNLQWAWASGFVAGEAVTRKDIIND